MVLYDLHKILRLSIILKPKQRFKNTGIRYLCVYKPPSNLDKESYLNKKSKDGIGLFGLCLGVVPITFLYLAIWQVRRKKWKEDLVSKLKLKPKLPVIDLPDDLTDRTRLEYRRVRVKGTFDHSKEMYVGHRSRIDNEEDTAEGFLFSDSNIAEKIGYFVITPFKLSDRNLTILVNRGWVPDKKKDPATRPEGQIQGEVELEGLVRLKEEDSFFLQDYDPKTRVFKNRDLAGMAEVANTSFLFIDAVKESTVPGGPIGGQTRVTLRNQHFSYILTWSGLGVLSAVMWIRKFIFRK